MRDSLAAMVLSVGIITVSDRCYSRETEDRSGENLRSLVNSGELFEARVVHAEIVADDFQQIQSAVLKLCADCDLVLTCGGTGLSPRDLTPEAVTPLLDRLLPSLPAAILQHVLPEAPLAPLSRAVAGVRAKTLVLTLPGSARGSEQCLRAAAPCLSHAVDIIQSRVDRIARQHANNSTTRPTARQAHEVKSKVKLSDVSQRPRESPYPAISVKEAMACIMRQVKEARTSTEVHVLECEGMVLDGDVTARVSLPPFAAAVKDGYAVRWRDGCVDRRVITASVAGSSPPPPADTAAGGDGCGPLAENCCVRISTGAPVPLGADAVVMVEDTTLLERDAVSGEEELVKILKQPIDGQEIREEGSDFPTGSLVCESGTLVGAFELAALVACGAWKVRVFAPPLLALLSTGDELLQPGEEPVPGRVYDTNRACLAALARSAGARLWRDWQHSPVPDLADQLLAALTEALHQCDVVVTTGGVSMGEHDLVKRVLVEDLSAEVRFGRVLVKPGLPTTFATLLFNGKKKFLFCLPGNPVSAAVCFSLFVQPAIRLIRGIPDAECIQRVPVTLPAPCSIPLDARPEYARAIVRRDSDGGYRVVTVATRSCSSNVLSLVKCNALLELPAKSQLISLLKAGDQVSAILL